MMDGRFEMSQRRLLPVELFPSSLTCQLASGKPLEQERERLFPRSFYECQTATEEGEKMLQLENKGLLEPRQQM